MKKIAILLFIFSVSKSYCQNNKITIIDSLTKLPISRVYISNDLNKGAISDEKGCFNLNEIISNAKLLKISSIGYFEKHIEASKISNNDIIYLSPKFSSLDDVTVFTSGTSLVKKSLNKLKINYQTSPFKIKGLYRIQNIDSTNNYQFTSDALIEYFINPTEKNDKIKTVVLKNESKQNRTSNLHWYGYANYIDPIINESAFINQKDLVKYKFTNYGKFIYNGKITFNIGFVKKNEKSVSGIIYIDSISNAIVKITREYFDPPKELFKKKIVYGKMEFEYMQFSDKWYLKKFNITTQHENYHNPTILSDFLTISIDSNNYTLSNDIFFIKNNTENEKIRPKYDSLLTGIETRTLEDTNYFRAIILNKPLISIDIKNDSIINEKEYALQEEKLLSKTIPISRSGYGINILQPYKVDPSVGLYIESKNIFNFRLGLGYNNNLKFNNSNQSSILFDFYYTIKSNENKRFNVHPLIQFQRFYGKKIIENKILNINDRAVSGGIKIDYHLKTDRLLSGKLTYSLPNLYGNSILDKNSVNFSVIYSGILY